MPRNYLEEKFCL